MAMTCGEATIRLLAKYGITKVFGIPGVHTLDMCRGLSGGENSGKVTHVQARNEQGAGFMAEGWARATGNVGVALVISGPGVTNASTALGQSYADSLPMLLISAEPDSHTIGKGWGVLHEVTEQKKITEPITALSATAYRPSDIPELFAQAFTIFSSQRPRPVHISIPLDVQAQIVEEDWQPVALPERPAANSSEVNKAADLLRKAQNPLILIGGGAAEASKEIIQIAENIGAIVLSSTAGKGIVPDDHPLSLSASTVRPEVQELLPEADVVLAIGTEISETDSFVEKLDITGDIIRIDIDSKKISDFYPAKIGLVADAKSACSLILEALGPAKVRQSNVNTRLKEIRDKIFSNLTPSETRHTKFLKVLRKAASKDTIFSGDACQLVYTGSFTFPVAKPRKWFYPAGFCALGNALPNAIGAKLAQPDLPVVVLAGDGGFMFTMPELLTAVESDLGIPVIIWENGGLKQIQDDMDLRDIVRVGVEGINPDFELLAKACHCKAFRPKSEADFLKQFKESIGSDKPTLIIINEEEEWLQ